MLQTDYLVVVDIECTCWKNHMNPPGEQSEIIEIGICLLHLETLEISQAQGLLVKPTRSKVSPFCTELTSLTPELVAEGMDFAEACARLEVEYGTPQRTWGSWGNYDRQMFTDQCRNWGVDYPFSSHHLNLKVKFARLQSLERAIGMAGALRYAQLPLEGRHHRGVDDARNIATLSAYLIQNFGVEAVLK